MSQITKTCPHCGQIVEANAPFCPQCGKALRQESALKKAKKRLDLSAIAGIAVFIGMIGSCLVVLGGSAWLTLRLIIQQPIFALLVLVIWLVRMSPRFRRARIRKRLRR